MEPPHAIMWMQAALLLGVPDATGADVVMTRRRRFLTVLVRFFVVIVIYASVQHFNLYRLCRFPPFCRSPLVKVQQSRALDTPTPRAEFGALQLATGQPGCNRVSGYLHEFGSLPDAVYYVGVDRWPHAASPY